MFQPMVVSGMDAPAHNTVCGGFTGTDALLWWVLHVPLPGWWFSCIMHVRVTVLVVTRDIARDWEGLNCAPRRGPLELIDPASEGGGETIPIVALVVRAGMPPARLGVC
jgi:hypothetical protein